MKHLFIVNPVAGKGKAVELIPQIKDIFKNRSDIYFVEVTARVGHATEIVKRYVSTDVFRVYSVGGDGTLNEVLNGLIGSNSSLAVIPSGSGNDFIKSIIKNQNISNILKRTIDGNEELIDLAKANEREFINISSIGFDAEVVYQSRKFKRLPFVNGTLGYVLGIIFTVFRYKSKKVEIMIDEKTINEKALLIAIANGKYYGGGMMPTPDAQIDDGKLDICLIKDLNPLKILSFFPKIMKGRHGQLKEVSFYRGSRIEVLCEKEMALNIDGEVSKTKEAIFEIIPKGIKVVIPTDDGI